MRGSARQGRERKGGYVLVSRGVGGRGAIRKKIVLENQEDFTEQVCWVQKNKQNKKTEKVTSECSESEKKKE